MVKARVILQNLKTLSYNFSPSDLQLAADFTQKLGELYHTFYFKIPNESGIVIRPPDQKSLRSTRRREHTAHDADDFASLPPHKKVKKSSHHVGIKADRKRKRSELQVHVCIKLLLSSSQIFLTTIHSSAQSSSFSKKSHLPQLVCISHITTILYHQIRNSVCSTKPCSNIIILIMCLCDNVYQAQKGGSGVVGCTSTDCGQCTNCLDKEVQWTGLEEAVLCAEEMQALTCTNTQCSEC